MAYLKNCSIVATVKEMGEIVFFFIAKWTYDGCTRRWRVLFAFGAESEGMAFIVQDIHGACVIFGSCGDVADILNVEILKDCGGEVPGEVQPFGMPCFTRFVAVLKVAVNSLCCYSFPK